MSYSILRVYLLSLIKVIGYLLINKVFFYPLKFVLKLSNMDNIYFFNLIKLSVPLMFKMVAHQ